MVVDNLFSLIHATVADIDSIAIEDFSELVLFLEVFVYKGKESVTDIDDFVEWGVVPEDVFIYFLFAIYSIFYSNFI